MSDFGILAFGAYVPITRLQRSAIHATNKWFAKGLGGLAKGEKAIANWDEDSVTMALEAARDALEHIAQLVTAGDRIELTNLLGVDGVVAAIDLR